VLNDLLGHWNSENTEISFPQYVYNCRNGKNVLSNELNSLFKIMDIHSDHESEDTESDNSFIPPFLSANFEDVLHKMDNEWNGYWLE
jgi:hypothetical protein